jgi:hypothetical protein
MALYNPIAPGPGYNAQARMPVTVDRTAEEKRRREEKEEQMRLTAQLDSQQSAQQARQQAALQAQNQYGAAFYQSQQANADQAAQAQRDERLQGYNVYNQQNQAYLHGQSLEQQHGMNLEQQAIGHQQTMQRDLGQYQIHSQLQAEHTNLQAQLSQVQLNQQEQAHMTRLENGISQVRIALANGEIDQDTARAAIQRLRTGGLDEYQLRQHQAQTLQTEAATMQAHQQAIIQALTFNQRQAHIAAGAQGNMATIDGVRYFIDADGTPRALDRSQSIQREQMLLENHTANLDLAYQHLSDLRQAALDHPEDRQLQNELRHATLLHQQLQNRAFPENNRVQRQHTEEQTNLLRRHIVDLQSAAEREPENTALQRELHEAQADYHRAQAERLRGRDIGDERQERQMYNGPTRADIERSTREALERRHGIDSLPNARLEDVLSPEEIQRHIANEATAHASGRRLPFNAQTAAHHNRSAIQSEWDHYINPALRTGETEESRRNRVQPTWWPRGAAHPMNASPENVRNFMEFEIDRRTAADRDRHQQMTAPLSSLPQETPAGPSGNVAPAGPTVPLERFQANIRQGGAPNAGPLIVPNAPERQREFNALRDALVNAHNNVGGLPLLGNQRGATFGRLRSILAESGGAPTPAQRRAYERALLELPASERARYRLPE